MFTAGKSDFDPDVDRRLGNFRPAGESSRRVSLDGPSNTGRHATCLGPVRIGLQVECQPQFKTRWTRVVAAAAALSDDVRLDAKNWNGISASR